MGRLIYYAFCEDYEAEGMYSESGELLGFWSCNDACWRNEYFSPFLEAVGIEIVIAPQNLQYALFDRCKELWGEYD